MTGHQRCARSVVRLDLLDWPEASPVAGAKLGRLAALGRTGLRVPAGFAVTAGAFEAHLSGTGPAAGIPALLASAPDPRDHAALASASAELRRLVREAPVAEGLRAEVADACAALSLRCGAPDGDVDVAVRSSGVSEDGAEHSFAGMFESFLGVRGPDAVVRAVRDCWASLFTHRALAYRLHAGLPLAAPAMAVGVMVQVSGVASGVAFSMHPVTGISDRVVVEAAPGLGGAVVAEGSEPERVEVDKADGRVLRRHRGASGTGPVLTSRDVDRVVAAVCRAEDVLGHPVDVEWVLDGRGRVWILQARPVTAAEPVVRDGTTGWDPTAFLCDVRPAGA